MLIFSELETGTLDLRLDFYGYEDCLPDQFFGPAIRENYVLHYITEGKGYLEYRKQKIPLQKGDFFLLIPGEVTYYFADTQTPWSYYWLGISGIKAQEYFNLSSIHDTAYLRSNASESNFSKVSIENAKSRIFKTAAGCRLLESIFLREE